MTTLIQPTGQARIKRLTSSEAKALTVATVSGFAPNMVADHDIMLSQQAFADFVAECNAAKEPTEALRALMARN